MFFGEQLSKLQNDEKNPINRMYLTEIGIKWKSLEEIFKKAAEPKFDLAKLASALTDFTKELNNSKYINSKNAKGGFKANSVLFKPVYIDDLLSIIIEQTNIKKFKGIRWGYQGFSNGFSINPKMQYLGQKDKIFTKSKSHKFLSVVQCMDINFRMSQTRTFTKEDVEFPILIFSTHKVFKESDLLQFESEVFEAKKTYSKAYSIVVTEYIDNNFYPKLKNSSIDSIFVLRKQSYQEKKTQAINGKVISALREKIFECLFEEKSKQKSFKETGIIE